MTETETSRAVSAAKEIAASLDFDVDDSIVLHESNRYVIRLLPCDLVARVVPITHFASAELEVAVARQLALTDSPVAPLDPRVAPSVFVRDEFKITMWTYLDARDPRGLPSAAYAEALERVHAGLRQVDVDAPHCTERIASVEADVVNRDLTPDLSDADRTLLASALRERRQVILDRSAPEQLLHGEPHPWNVLVTQDGPLLTDFENACRGPVEYDLAWVPDAVLAQHPDVDAELVDDCRGAVLAMIAAHRWRRDDVHPSGRRSGVAFLDALRRGPPWPALDDVIW